MLRKLRLQSLENRRVMASIVVDSNSDFVDAADAQTTLREAILAANELKGHDTIEFGPSVSGSIFLTEGPLSVTDHVTIVGPGSGQLTIDLSRNDPTPFDMNGDGSSAMIVDQPRRGPFIETNLSGLTFQRADANVLDNIFGSIKDVVIKDNFGTGIVGPQRFRLSDEIKLVIEDSRFVGNRGRAISAEEIVIHRSEFISNETMNASFVDEGGAIRVGNFLEVHDSNFSSNSSTDDGGAIFGIGRTGVTSRVLIVNSTFEGNRTSGPAIGDTPSGSAVALRAYQDVTIIGSTFSGNEIRGGGNGAINVGQPLDDGGLTVLNSTIVNNLAEGIGGIDASQAWLRMRNSIAAGNSNSDIFPSNDVRFSLIGKSSSNQLPPSNGKPDANGNLVGSPQEPLDPLLMPLAHNGGIGFTHRPRPESPVIDLGDPDFDSSDPIGKFDGRGEPYRRVINRRLDIGAVEFLSAEFGDLTQDNVLDIRDVDRLCEMIRAGQHDSAGDFNANGVTDGVDLDILIVELFDTTRGDSDLDGRFDSTDLVNVFTAAEYEDDLPSNSTWQTGDWNCDGEFDTRDLVAAFQVGGYISASQQPQSLIELAASIDGFVEPKTIGSNIKEVES